MPCAIQIFRRYPLKHINHYNWKFFFRPIIKAILTLFYIFPIKRNRIIFEAYKGQQYSCNPKYIYQKLIELFPCSFDIVWVLQNPNDLTCGNARCVRRNSISYIYYMMTSHILVNNSGFNAYIPYRKPQLKINTWHGGGAYKKVGIDRANHDIDEKHILENGHPTDIFLSSCHKFSICVPKSNGIDEKAVWEIGMPRNDILMSSPSDNYDYLKREIGLKNHECMVLYAPTYRGVFDNPTYKFPDLNINLIRSTLNAKFGGDWVFAYRSHYTYKNQNALKIPNTIDLTSYPDMQELLLCADILLTDYSSSIWDFSLTKKPCFLYIPDVSDYTKKVDFYTPIAQWPFPQARTNEELAEKISKFNQIEYEQKLENHLLNLGCCETGIASELCADVIYKYSFQSLEKEEMLKSLKKEIMYSNRQDRKIK